MSINRKEELQRIVNESFLQEERQKRIFFINGIFGVGKTWLVNAIIEIFAGNKLCDAFLKFDNPRDVSFLPDYFIKCIGNNIDENGKMSEFTINEISFQNEEFYNLLNKIKHNKPYDYETIIEDYFISNTSYFKQNKNNQNKNKLNNSLDELLTRNSEKRMLFSTGRVLAEALIVDIISNFFPIDKTHNTLQSYRDEGIRKKILITFDNFDSISISILDFLFKDLFPLAFNLKFSEFISQKFTSINNDTKVSDLIEFRIVIATRQKAIEHYRTQIEDTLKDYVSELELIPFSREDIEQLLNNVGYENTNIEQVIRITHGIPCILELWFESKKYEDNEENEEILFRLTNDRINKYFNDYEKEWLRIASHLEKFDENLLRCFPEMNKNYKEVWNFFTINNDLTEFIGSKKDFLTIKSLIRYYLHQIEPENALENKSTIRKIENLYNTVDNILKDLNNKQRQILLSLSYFKNFDITYVVKNFLQSDLHYVSQFVQTHPNLFIKNQYTYSVIDEYRNKLMEFNKYWDQEKYEEKQSISAKTWELFKNEITTKKTRLEKELDILQIEEKDLLKGQNENKHTIESKQNKIIQYENELIVTRRRINLYAVRNYIRKAGFCFVLGLFIIFISLFTDSIFKNSFSQEALSTLNSFLQILAILFGFCGLLYSFKYIFNKTRKREIEKLKQKINSIETNKEKEQMEIKQINEEIAIAQNRIDYINEKSKQIMLEISELNAQLRENFV